MSSTPVTISTDDLATPWQRLGAVFIDGLLLLIPWVVLIAGPDYYSGRSSLWVDVAATVLVAAYHVVGTALWGQTVGKKVARIRVCSGRNLGRPGWVRAIKRWGVYVVVGYVPVVGGLLTVLIPLPLLWTASRQGLHDMFADTLVLRDEAVPWA